MELSVSDLLPVVYYFGEQLAGRGCFEPGFFVK